MTRTCKACNKPLIPRPKEWPSKFRVRMCCNMSCARRLRGGGMPRGYVMPKKQVPCSGGCGAMLLRAHHYLTAACESCQERRRIDRQIGLHARRREQARRYRIITHVLGWEEDQFNEMLQEMKRSPMAFRKRAEGRNARYDMAIEFRRRSA
jgi:hypothetical protein